MKAPTKENLCDLLTEAAQKMNCLADEIKWYSWPTVFPSTAGPRGIGGSAMTEFQVFGFAHYESGQYLKCCAGVWRKWDGEMNGRW